LLWGNRPLVPNALRKFSGEGIMLEREPFDPPASRNPTRYKPTILLRLEERLLATMPKLGISSPAEK
jgi:hypothetical protein